MESKTCLTFENKLELWIRNFFLRCMENQRKKKPQEIIQQPAAVKSNKQKAKTEKKGKHIVDEIK